MRIRRWIEVGCTGAALSLIPVTAFAQGRSSNAPRVQAAALKKDLFIIAADSMGGRDTGSRGNYLTAAFVAAQFRAAGLEPAGDNGTYFQTIPFLHTYLDPASIFTAGGRKLRPGFEYTPVFLIDGALANAPVIFGGIASDTTTWITAEQAAGAFVVFAAAPEVTARTSNTALNTASRNQRFKDAAGFALIALDLVPVDQRGQRLQGRFSAVAPSATGANS